MQVLAKFYWTRIGGGLFSALLESCFERVIGIEAAPQA